MEISLVASEVSSSPSHSQSLLVAKTLKLKDTGFIRLINSLLIEYIVSS